jgi:hypothetical protein
MLKNMVISTMSPDGRVTDQAGRAELARVAGDPKHPQQALARKAIADIANANYKKRVDAALPQGSVFKGGR